jgi:hypothetical protein
MDRLPAHVELRFLEDGHHARGVLLVAVARDLDEIEGHVHGHLAHEVGTEEHGPLQDAERDEVGALELGGDLPRHLGYTPIDLIASD